MPEELKNTSNTDLSGMFSTYKTHPDEDEQQGSNGYMSSNIQMEPVMTIKNEAPKNQEDIIEIPKCDTPFQKKMYVLETFSRHFLKAIRLIIDGFVRITKAAVWSIAVLGGLFVAALATNTIDRAISIINSNIGTHITLSGEVNVVKKEDTAATPAVGLTSNALGNSTSSTPDALASKRRAILEAKKAAKLMEEKQKAAEQSLQ